MKRAIWLSALAFALAFVVTLPWKLGPELMRPKYVDPAFRISSPLQLASIPTATHFDFPLGNENGAMAYNAQHFTENRHLGDDLNGIGGENSDLGDPIYAIADGRVLLARDGGPSWGNVVIVLHAYIENGAGGSRATSTKSARFGAASKSQRWEPAAAVISRICILRCANSSRRSLGQAIAQTHAAGWIQR